MASTRSSGLIRALTLFCLFFSTACALRQRQVRQCSPSKWSKIGCYISDWNEPALKLSGGTLEYSRLEDLTIKSCRRRCSDFEYFGLTNGNWCFCGNYVHRPVTDDAMCNAPCAGNVSQNCGGEGAMKVYKQKDFGLQSSSLSSSTLLSSSIPVASSDTSSLSLETTTTTSESLTTTTSSVISSETSLPVGSSVPTIASSTSSSTSSSSSSSSSWSSLSSSIGSSWTTTSSSTSTAPTCTMTTSFIIGTRPCWGRMPDVCGSLTSGVPWPQVTTAAVSCRIAFASSSWNIPSATACFTSISSPQFNPVSAYSCVQNVPGVICPTTETCVNNTMPTNLVTNGDFETGSLVSWQLWSASPAAELYLKATVASGEIMARAAGTWSFKLAYNNMGGQYRQWKQVLKLEPTARYEVSYWWYITSGQCNVVSSLIVSGGGINRVNKQTNHYGLASGVWTQVTEQFEAVASFGEMFINVDARVGAVGCTLYLDDYSVKKVLI